ncbi:hypothetical protein J6590_024350 [Homalodisca vitripennis]|nr:hypothetical protein J6590_024350 [Homalodisca vitripennis]
MAVCNLRLQNLSFKENQVKSGKSTVYKFVVWRKVSSTPAWFKDLQNHLTRSSTGKPVRWQQRANKVLLCKVVLPMLTTLWENQSADSWQQLQDTCSLIAYIGYYSFTLILSVSALTYKWVSGRVLGQTALTESSVHL